MGWGDREKSWRNGLQSCIIQPGSFSYLSI
jgi:hypothetical protein